MLCIALNRHLKRRPSLSSIKWGPCASGPMGLRRQASSWGQGVRAIQSTPYRYGAFNRLVDYFETYASVMSTRTWRMILQLYNSQVDHLLSIGMYQPRLSMP